MDHDRHPLVSLSILFGPLLCSCNGCLFILLPVLRNIGRKRIVRVRSTKQSLDRQKDCSDLQCRGPVICLLVSKRFLHACCWRFLTLQDIETDSAKFVYVGVEDLCEKANFRWCHRIVFRKEQFQLKNAPYLVISISMQMNLDVVVSFG